MTLNDLKGFDNPILGGSYLVVWLLHQSISHVYCLHCTAALHSHERHEHQESGYTELCFGVTRGEL